MSTQGSDGKKYSGQVTACVYNLAWIGPCSKPGKPYCNEHAVTRCCSCGAQATHQCPETYSLVCGYPLCDGCVDNGHGRHIPRNPPKN